MPATAAQGLLDLFSDFSATARNVSSATTRSRRAVFHIELAENVLDVFADGAGLRAENDADIVIAFAL